MLFKKIKCRHFHPDGRSRVPSCGQGSDCRFLHPGDQDWPSDPGGNVKDRTKSRHVSLVSQDDLYLQKKLDESRKLREPSKSHRATISHPSCRIQDSRSRRERPDSLFSSTRYEGSSSSSMCSSLKKPTGRNHSARTLNFQDRRRFTNNRGSSPCLTPSGPRFPNCRSRTANDLENSLENNITSASSNNPANRSNTSASNEVPLTSTNVPLPKEPAQQIHSLFNDIARFSSQAALDLETQLREDKKLKAYTELSATLAKISSKSASVITPIIADIILKQAQNKHRIEGNLKAISNVWSEAFGLFISEASKTVDLRLEEAVKKVREEAASTSQYVSQQPTCSALGSRVAHEITSNLGEEIRFPLTDASTNQGVDARVMNGRTADYDRREVKKRRRIESVSPEPGPRSIEDLESSVHLVLTQMKTKMDEQARSLHSLMKENSELKASLLKCSSIVSPPSTSQVSKISH